MSDRVELWDAYASKSVINGGQFVPATAKDSGCTSLRPTIEHSHILHQPKCAAIDIKDKGEVQPPFIGIVLPFYTAMIVG